MQAPRERQRGGGAVASALLLSQSCRPRVRPSKAARGCCPSCTSAPAAGRLARFRRDTTEPVLGLHDSRLRRQFQREQKSTGAREQARSRNCRFAREWDAPGQGRQPDSSQARARAYWAAAAGGRDGRAQRHSVIAAARHLGVLHTWTRGRARAQVTSAPDHLAITDALSHAAVAIPCT